MATFLIRGEPLRGSRALTGPYTITGSYSTECYGSQGSIPRKKPVTSLLSSLTGHSVERTSNVMKPRSLIYGSTPSGDYFTVVSPVDFGGSSVNGSMVAAGDISAAYARADAHVLRKLKDLQWNAAVSAAELPQTMRFLAQSVRELWDYYRLARKGDFLRLSELYRNRDQRGKRVPRWPVRVTNRYLAFRFAVRPLVNEIDDVVKTLSRSDMKPLIRRCTGRDNLSAYDVSVALHQGNSNLPVTTVRKDNVELRRCVYVKVDPDTVGYKQLGLTNLPAALWELVPYSFMVDRVLPIGAFIRSLDATAGLSRISDYRVLKRDWYGSKSLHDGLVGTTYEQYTRSVNLGLPSPLSVIGSYSPSVDAQMLTDSLALLIQLRSRSPSKGF